jgi:alpha-mannosidase
MTDPVTSLVSQLSSTSICAATNKLRHCSQVNVQASWRYCAADLSIAEATQYDWLNCSVAQLNRKEHVAWSAGQKVLWLAQRLVIPQDLQGYPLDGLSLRLALTWWAEAAQIFVNGVGVQEGDLFDCSTRVLLSPSVTSGEEITVALRLVSPSHDDGALVRSLCIYESTGNDRLDPGFVADELAVLQRYLEGEEQALHTLAAGVAEIDWSALPDRQKFERSLFQVRSSLEFLSDGLRQRRIQLLGHAHLDLAWLWPISETWDVAQSTFESVLKLQQEFPDLIFCHSTPALYAWIEEHRPDLFSAIQQQVAAGCWEVVGGLWVEPELNLINGESIVRQLLYGQRYVLEKFGNVSTVAWLPDSFGFCATLPQILKQGGIEYFVTQKLRWNDTTEFPYGAFWWRSPDGTELFSLMSAPIGEGIDPLKMASYSCDWETQTSLQNALWFPGVGDHGGGPTRDMLEVHKRWQQSPFFPRLEFSTAQKYLQHIETRGRGAEGARGPHAVGIKGRGRERDRGELESTFSPAPLHPCTPAPFPVWEDELYLEFHRGCYTTHADQKRWNRRCEGLLYQAELFASLATLSAGVAYPKSDLSAAWKKVLFNQFHDILPGSSIPPVFVEVNSSWQEVEQLGLEILQQSLKAIASQVTLPSPPPAACKDAVAPPLPVLVFNSLNWSSSQVVAVPLPAMPPDGQSWHIYDSGQQLLSQLSQESTLLFLATDIPSVGYRVFWLACTAEEPLSNKHIFAADDWVLENELLRVVVDPETGDLCSVFDKTHQREVLSGPGNQLQAFRDSGQYWDAWNIDPKYAQHPLPPTQLQSIQWLERGSVQTRVRVVRHLGESEFCQDYILQARASVLKIATTVDWQERQVLVKAAFPLNLEADYATYEIPCGATERSTQPKTPTEQAKWEVPALRWADLSAANYGVSLLNDCKYGYDSQPACLRLTLLRSASWPDPEADRGFHEFTYALYPHCGNWQSAHTVKRGYELNLPLQVMLLPPISSPTSGKLPTIGRLLNLSAENLILMAFKQSEDHPQEWILRCYECHGETAQLSLQSDLGLSVAHLVDLLEQPMQLPEPSADGRIRIEPWKLASFTVMRPNA